MGKAEQQRDAQLDGYRYDYAQEQIEYFAAVVVALFAVIASARSTVICSPLSVTVNDC